MKKLIIGLGIMGLLLAGILWGLKLVYPGQVYAWVAQTGIPVPGIATQAVCPVLNIFSRVIGGMVKGKWVGPKEIAKHLKGKEQYKLYQLSKLMGEFKGVPTKVASNDPDDLTRIDFQQQNVYDATFGISCDWNPLPRIPKEKTSIGNVQDSFITGLLAKRGLKDVPVIIKKQITVDIDGDGNQETFITATNVTKKDLDVFESLDEAGLKELEKNKYTITVLRSKNRGIECNRVILQEYQCIQLHDIECIADIDNDNVLEFIINSESIDAVLAEGFSVGTRYLYKLKSGKWVKMGQYFNMPS